MDEAQVRSDLLELLEGRSAHGDLDALAEGLPTELRGVVPEGQSHSAWGLIEHMRRAIVDIVDFVEDPEHETPEWPAGFWPADPAPPSEAAWDEAIAEIRDYLEKLRDWVRDESFDLAAAPPHTGGRTPLRAALLAADHNAYHLGQLATIRKLLGVPASGP
ncbi:MAG: DinB family protein [Phycisphaeraceae bacterium]